MKFKEFKQSVQGWQKDKGIYDHSTPLAQALKAVSEVGEMADAVIKGDGDGIKDGIGDTAVCLIGVATMTGVLLEGVQVDSVLPDGLAEAAALASYMVGSVALNAIEPNNTLDLLSDTLNYSITCMAQVAQLAGFNFEECCEAAWLEIKDRKGRMVPGGAFVKDE